VHPADHCPFLNRHDGRCGQYLSLGGGLRHAYRHCFGSYQTCPVYFELLVERQTRRNGIRDAHPSQPIVSLTIRRAPIACPTSHAAAA
jgi:hypothetical protein